MLAKSVQPSKQTKSNQPATKPSNRTKWIWQVNWHLVNEYNKIGNLTEPTIQIKSNQQPTRKQMLAKSVQPSQQTKSNQQPNQATEPNEFGKETGT